MLSVNVAFVAGSNRHCRSKATTQIVLRAKPWLFCLKSERESHRLLSRDCGSTLMAFSTVVLSNYPPAEPEALRLLAPQRGRIATEKSKTNNCEPRIWTRTSSAKRSILPELSNFCCLPGRAGGSPYGLARRRRR